MQDCTTVEDVADWPPPLRRLVEAGVAPRGNTPAGARSAESTDFLFNTLFDLS